MIKDKTKDLINNIINKNIISNISKGGGKDIINNITEGKDKDVLITIVISKVYSYLLNPVG